jgi:lipid A 3-O-deacylase
MRFIFFFLVYGLLGIHPSHGQRVKWKSFRLTEENDFFNIKPRGIDRYYTQGVRFELTYKVSEMKILENLMIPASRNATNLFSLSLAQEIYTPNEQTTFEFVGDRPYAGALYFSQSLESMDTARQFRLTTRLHAGMFGPVAMAALTQLGVHSIIDNNLAIGWNTQIRNDLYLNYSLRAEKAITKQKSIFQVEGKGELNFGTALISVAAGVNFGLGTWNDLSRKFSWQIFFRPEGRVVLFNALLQGGVLNQEDANDFYYQYLIKKVKPLVYTQSLGFQVRFKRMELMYRQVNITSEFKGQLDHYYGSLMFTIPIKERIF